MCSLRVCFSIETHNSCQIKKNILNLLKPKPVTTFCGYLSKKIPVLPPAPHQLGKGNLVVATIGTLTAGD
jgi:hypothetical protein